MVKRVLIAMALLVAALGATIPSRAVAVCVEVNGRPVDTATYCVSTTHGVYEQQPEPEQEQDQEQEQSK